MNQPHAVVVGCGVFGVTASIELERRGWAVTLVDQGAVPNPKATSNDLNRVIRADYGSDDFFVDLGLEAIRRWRAWNESWDDAPYREDGFLLLSKGGLEPGTFEGDSYHSLRARGAPVERLDPRAVERRFPVWNAAGYQEAYFNPAAGWVRADRVLESLIARAVASGVTLRSGAAVEELVESDSAVGGVVVRQLRGDGTAGERTIHADVVVVATGSWTPSLIPALEDVMWPSAQPTLYLRPADPSRFRAPAFSPWAADLANSGWYGISGLPDGSVKVAHHGRGERVNPGDDLMLPAGAEPAFRNFLAGALPELAEAPITHARVCVYCDTWDGDFWIDHDPDRPGLVVATGGSGHGFKFAPVLGEIIADVVERRPGPRTSRFRWRERGAERTEDARAGAELDGAVDADPDPEFD